MKVAIKNKNEIKYIDAKEIQIGDVTLEELYQRTAAAEQIVTELVQELQGAYIVKKDTPYIINTGKLVRVEKIDIFEAKNYKLPLRFYKVENGKLVIDKKKVGAL